MTVHDLSFARSPELFSRRDRTLLKLVRGSVRRAARVIAVSEFTRTDLCEVYGVDPGKVVAIPNGVSAAFRPVEGAKELVLHRFGIDRPYVLCVGALQPRKNVPLAIEAYAQVAGRGTDCEFVIAGGDRGGRLDVLDAILRTGLTGRVHLVGRVEDETLPALEAMACGTPVVASNTTGLAEAVGDAGLTVDPHSAAELAGAIRRVLDDTELSDRLVAAGLARAAEFSWARTARATADVYHEALA